MSFRGARVLAVLLLGQSGAGAVLAQTDGAAIDPLAPMPLVLDPGYTDPTAGVAGQDDPSLPAAQISLAPHAEVPLTDAQTSTAPVVAEAPGAILRGLDKVAGVTKDLTVRNGQSTEFGTLKVAVSDCRYPTDNPAADAYAHLSITETTAATPAATLFDGWMVASSPALSALDHPRYDVWVLRCTNS